MGIGHNVLILKCLRVVVSPISGLDIHFSMSQYSMSYENNIALIHAKSLYTGKTIVMNKDLKHQRGMNRRIVNHFCPKRKLRFTIHIQKILSSCR